ncbi:zinc finger RNA-binding protein [Tripterygium wilfordii]|uniref:Zinc finger RNA-binding protein n=1 Tax=Tripterygium wilfordii TaxID=458696 RepID=A0A7J7CNB2_TRIWF|nr:uncharacterized protein LOC120016143 [Tripterygium wilfordii]KAF5735582.1 zinc finger RNA-binding protein [Tripterygium wilfordii]
MDYSNIPGTQANNLPGMQSNPPAATIDQYSSNYSNLYYPTLQVSQNPNSHQFYAQPATIPTVAVDASAAVSSYTHALHHGTYDAAFGYYYDPNLQNWAANEAVRQCVSDPAALGGTVGVTTPLNGIEQSTIGKPSSTLWGNLTVQSGKTSHWKKQLKKAKIVQSAYCEICKVDCNSKDVLDQHKLGKKHKKNVEKLLIASAPPPIASAVSNNPVIGPQENPNKSKNKRKSKKKAADTVEDLEIKRRKVVEGGAAMEAVRTCPVCNVVCNSETVFKYHIAGQKHAAMLKKHAAGIGLATGTTLTSFANP